MNFPHPDGLARAKACAAPGRCVFCEEPVPEGRVRCSSESCRGAYYRAWHRDARVLHPERYGARFYAARRAERAA